LWRFRTATDSATEVETALQRILSGLSADYSSEIERLGGGDQTVKIVAAYLHHRKRIIENKREEIREAARSVLESSKTPANDTEPGSR
jgi:hypothetical protein